jgi:hypothetical protein
MTGTSTVPVGSGDVPAREPRRSLWARPGSGSPSFEKPDQDFAMSHSCLDVELPALIRRARSLSEQTLEKLRGMWKGLSGAQPRGSCWDYVNIIIELSRRCSGNA